MYEVVTQTPTTDIGPTGSIVQAMQVTFRTKPSEITSKVVIPLAMYTPEEVDRAVTAAAQTIETIQSL